MQARAQSHTGRNTKLRLAAALACAVVALGATVAHAQSPRELRLDYQQTFATRDLSGSLFVRLREDGEARVVNYYRNTRSVLAIFEGKLPPKETAAIFSRARQRLFRQALRRVRAYPRHPGDANLFELSVENNGGRITRRFSSTEKAPRVLFTVVNELLKIKNRLPEQPLADDYLRGRPYAGEELSQILRNPRIKFAPLSDYPEELRGVVGRALDAPGDFVALSQTHLASLTAFGRFYASWRQSYYELSLYRQFNTREPEPPPYPPKTTSTPNPL